MPPGASRALGYGSVFSVYTMLCASPGVTVFFQFMAHLILILIHFFGSKFLRANKEKVIIFLSSIERKPFRLAKGSLARQGHIGSKIFNSVTKFYHLKQFFFILSVYGFSVDYFYSQLMNVKLYSLERLGMTHFICLLPVAEHRLVCGEWFKN